MIELINYKPLHTKASSSEVVFFRDVQHSVGLRLRGCSAQTAGSWSFSVRRLQKLLCRRSVGQRGEVRGETSGRNRLRLRRRGCLGALLLHLSEPLRLGVLSASPFPQDLDVVGGDESRGLTVHAGQQPSTHPRL